jgi:thiol-disulfide isomerase/thioredoxin
MFNGTKVIELTDKNFDLSGAVPRLTNVSKGFSKGPGKMMVYSSSCPYCLAKREMYSDLAERMNGGKTQPVYIILAINSREPEASGVISKLDFSGVPSYFNISNEGEVKNSEDPFNESNVLSKILDMEPEEVEELRQTASFLDSLDIPESEEEIEDFEIKLPTSQSQSQSQNQIEESFEEIDERSLPPKRLGAFGQTIDAFESSQYGSGRSYSKSDVRKCLTNLSLSDLKKLAKENKRPVSGTKKQLVDNLLK